MGYFIHQLFSLNMISQRDRKHVSFLSAARTIRSTAENFELDLPHNSAVLVAFAHRSFLCVLLPAVAVALAPQHPRRFSIVHRVIEIHATLSLVGAPSLNIDTFQGMQVLVEKATLPI